MASPSIAQDVEFCIRQKYSWDRLPANVKQASGAARLEGHWLTAHHSAFPQGALPIPDQTLQGSAAAYERAILEFSIRNQLRFKGNLVKDVAKDPKKYYERLVNHSQESLMLFPYHLQDMLIQGLRITPFQYYHAMMQMLMQSEKSYDSLPNFTAADGVRLLGIGRNQYIDIMNTYRAKNKFFRRRNAKDLLPTQPVEDISFDWWWKVNIGYITEEDVKNCPKEEHDLIDFIIDHHGTEAGLVDYGMVRSLYRRGLVYFNIPISDEDLIVVPTLQGFVMNRTQGDYLENLLYKIFVSLDERTSMEGLAAVLQIDLEQVKHAVSVFIRLGFARKKNVVEPDNLHPSWSQLLRAQKPFSSEDPLPSPDLIPCLRDENGIPKDVPQVKTSDPSVEGEGADQVLDATASELASPQTPFFSPPGQKRIGFMFDSSLTAFLMMGNLSPGLKNHAVTMFEVGKLTDETLDNFLAELDKVGSIAEGEAQRYFDHAVTLKSTIQFFRKNPDLKPEMELGQGVDLLRCESLNSLDNDTLCRILQKNYDVLVSMAPLGQDVQPVVTISPPHLGPPIPEVNSIWFKLWLYKSIRSGPCTVLLSKGIRLRKLPEILKGYRHLMMTPWGHDATLVNGANLLLTLNDALTHSSVLVQGSGWDKEGHTVHVPFPFDREGKPEDDLVHHPALRRLEDVVDLSASCGYVTMLRSGVPREVQLRARKNRKMPSTRPSLAKETESHPEIAEFLDDLKDLGIGDFEGPVSDNKEGHRSVTVPTQEAPPPVGMAQRGEDSGERELTAAELSLVEEWVPLEMYFGIPLFNEEANKAVCKKIISNGLFKRESLEKHTHQCRLLTLSVMEFIALYQENPQCPEFDSTHTKMESSILPTPLVPLPTHCLTFDGQQLDLLDVR